MAHRRMADLKFQRDQWDQRYVPHIRPVNQLVDHLVREHGTSMPYVAPLYGGVKAKVLFLFQDPGPGTNLRGKGSGFLCSENDDRSAELFATCLDDAGLPVGDVVTWNIYPWHLDAGQHRPSASQVNRGTAPLYRLLHLLPRLKVVMPMGRVAQDGWSKFVRAHPEAARRYRVIPGMHTSRRGITGGGHHSKERGVGIVLTAMKEARGFIA